MKEGIFQINKRGIIFIVIFLLTVSFVSAWSLSDVFKDFNKYFLTGKAITGSYFQVGEKEVGNNYNACDSGSCSNANNDDVADSATCPNTGDYADCVFNGQCYLSWQGNNGQDVVDVNRDGVKGEFCTGGKWWDCDGHETWCSDNSLATREKNGINYNDPHAVCGYDWVKSGEENVGEYNHKGAVECCGDDPNEYYINDNGFERCCPIGKEHLDENGNCIKKIEEGLPDLIISKVEISPKKIKLGDNIFADVYLKNIGSATAILDGSLFDFYSILNDEWFYGHTYDLPDSITLKSNEEIVYTIKLRDYPVTGNYTLQIEVDPYNNLEESNKTNNLFLYNYTVYGWDLSEYPAPFLNFKNKTSKYYIVISRYADEKEKAAAVKIKNSLDRENMTKLSKKEIIISEKEYEDNSYFYKDYNLIILGTPCTNNLLKGYLNLIDCNEWKYKENEALIKLIEERIDGGFKTNLLISAMNSEDILKASYILEHYKENREKGLLKGTEVLIDTKDIILDCFSGISLNACLDKKPKYCDQHGNVIDNCFICDCDVGRCLASGSCTSEVSKLDIATNKLQYYKNEIIKLTSPDYLLESEDGSSTQSKTISPFYTSRYNREINIYSSLLDKKDTPRVNNIPIRGYIIQFKNDPILNKLGSMEKDAIENQRSIQKMSNINPVRLYKEVFAIQPEDVSNKIKKYKDEIQKEHINFEKDLSKITGYAVSDLGSSKTKILGKFENVFNGIALDITEAQANELAKRNDVKAVYPNYAIHLNLENQNESIEVKPLESINAKKVWDLKDNNGLTITGKGVSIAILDTGIDYTHEDLGGCNIYKVSGEMEPYSLESPHFYGNNMRHTYTIKKPGFENIAVHFSKIDMESGWDYLIISNSSGYIIQKYTGFYKDRWSLSVPGDTIKITIETDSSIVDWGFAIDKIVNGISVINWSDCEKVVDGFNFVSGDLDPIDDHFHGTHVAGIVAADGVMKGVAPDAKLIAYKVLDRRGSGWNDDIIEAIERSADPNGDYDYFDRVDVISLSLGGAGDPNDPLSQAINNVVKAGVVAVVAAGNDGPGQGTIDSPGTAKDAITVGASCTTNQLYKEGSCASTTPYIADFSSRGPTYLYDKPDVVAPGVEICSSLSKLFRDNFENKADFEEFMEEYGCIDNEHIKLSGTSMATPHVSGAVTLIKQAHPSWTPEQIKSALKLTAKNYGYKHEIQGNGNIDVLSVVKLESILPESKLEEGLTEVIYDGDEGGIIIIG